MINRENLSKLLVVEGFTQLTGKDAGIWFKSFGDSDLRVDFNSETLIYPEYSGLVVNERQTCNFSANENFVVFECVNKLLSRGYKPKNIELEPRWQLGHGMSGGRADILVKDNNGNSYLVIECKTWGEEFENEWKNMLQFGGQLFSYAQQVRSTQFVCLYTSNFENDVTLYTNHIITLNDNFDYLRSLQNPASFKDATDVQSLFRVWDKTYNKEFETQGIFEGNISAFSIGKKSHSTSDLYELKHSDIQSKYHEFATILRQHNVSGRENAFDKLVNLFLAKIVDEMQNTNELKFYWKGFAFDDYYSLQDRIQKLYRDGMQKFLDEEVTYIDDTAITDAFRLFKSDPDATRNTITKYFRQLKFYTNNDFAFLDVHNEHLFIQNSAILLKIVKMIQDIKLKTEEQNQFLGDLFEGFLDQGVKQSEGQYFTPTPVVKFIVSSLPLESLESSKSEIPYAIDYACGAGHFLNEYASQLKTIFPGDKLHDYYSRIFGIEKEYRLSKVAKVSSFMYGQDEIRIIYADALSRSSSVKDNSFDVLISNPPYSVKGFLEMLSEEERNSFSLTKTIDKKNIFSNNSIEAFFVERAKQLLKPKGVAAIILPSSILTNGNSLYTKTREIILESFDLIAITEFGSGTFGKTGTNTVTLFLQRKEQEPAISDHIRNRVDAWFRGDFDKDQVFEDREYLEKYCEYFEFDFEDYISLLQTQPNDGFLEHEIILGYREPFSKLSEVKAMLRKKSFISLSEAEKDLQLKTKFIKYIKSLEMEKMYYFILGLTNPHPVLVVRSPAESAEMKKFLGYEWSTAKGNEGIKYLGVNSTNQIDDVVLDLEGINSISTPLFNPIDLNDQTKINSAIKSNFLGQRTFDNQYVKYLSLVDMIDFRGVKLEKQISLTAKRTIEVESKYPLIALGKACKIMIGGTPSRSNNSYFENGTNLWVSIAEMNSQVITTTKEMITDKAVADSNVKLIRKGTTLLSFKLSIGKVAIAGSDLYTNEAIAGLVPHNPDEYIDKYFYHLFRADVFSLENLGTKAFGISLNSDFLKYDLYIPNMPLPLQKEMVEACDKVDIEINKQEDILRNYEMQLDSIFRSLKESSSMKVDIGNESIFETMIGNRVLKSELQADGTVPVFSANVKKPFGFTNKLSISDFESASILWGIDGDWQVSIVESGEKFYPTDHCGVLRVKNKDIDIRYVKWALYEAGQETRFSRSMRASVDRIRKIEIKLPNQKLTDQLKIEITELEDKISNTERSIEQLELQHKRTVFSFIL